MKLKSPRPPSGSAGVPPATSVSLTNQQSAGRDADAPRQFCAQGQGELPDRKSQIANRNSAPAVRISSWNWSRACRSPSSATKTDFPSRNESNGQLARPARQPAARKRKRMRTEFVFLQGRLHFAEPGRNENQSDGNEDNSYPNAFPKFAKRCPEGTTENSPAFRTCLA